MFDRIFLHKRFSNLKKVKIFYIEFRSLIFIIHFHLDKLIETGMLC